MQYVWALEFFLQALRTRGAGRSAARRPCARVPLVLGFVCCAAAPVMHAPRDGLKPFLAGRGPGACRRARLPSGRRAGGRRCGPPPRGGAATAVASGPSVALPPPPGRRLWGRQALFQRTVCCGRRGWRHHVSTPGRYERVVGGSNSGVGGGPRRLSWLG